MGHHISVFYFVIDYSEIPTSMDSWIDVSDLLTKYYESKDGLGYQSVSWNWWHQYALDDVCKGLGIEGLEFVVKEVVCLESIELRQAQEALKKVSENWYLC